MWPPGGHFQYCAVHQYAAVRCVWGPGALAMFLISAATRAGGILSPESYQRMFAVHVPCFRCFALQPGRESDQKPKCRTQHALAIICCFRALSMSRRLDSHNSKVCQTQRSQFAEAYGKDDRIPGIDPWASSLCSHVPPTCVNFLTATLFNLSGWLVALLVREDVRTPPDMVITLWL